MSFSFSDAVVLFFVYGVLGWAGESVYRSIRSNKVTPRGFLFGPYITEYGVGALMLLLLEPLREMPAFIFPCAFVMAFALEYALNLAREKLLGLRSHDIAKRKMQLHERACLSHALALGVAGTLAFFFLQPFALDLIARIPATFERVLASLLIAVLVLDLATTLSALSRLSEKLGNPAAKGGTGLGQRYARRVLTAYPDMRSMADPESANTLRSLLDAERAGARDGQVRRLTEAVRSLARSFKSSAQETAPTPSFASGIHFYKLCWVFYISSVIGYILETLFCLVTTGRIESRQGMIYGPFNQVYGFGAVLMVLILHRLTGYKDRWIFLGGALVGGAFEFLSSLFQECFFGSTSWEYSGQVLDIGGRTSLMYMLFWGILGVVLIKSIYPAMSRLIERIPNRQGILFSWVLLVLICADLAISSLAVARWDGRVQGRPPESAVAVFLDENYPDDMLAEIYPNMHFVSMRN